MKTLILKPSSLGDVIQALPVLRLLKQHNASNEIFWWLSSDLVPLLEDDPDLAGILPFDRRRWAYPRGWRRNLDSIREMRAHRFDWVIDLQSLARSGLFAWLANGRLTIGLDDAREGARGFYDLIVPRPSFFTHAVDWYLEVLRKLSVPVHWNFDWMPLRPKTASTVRKKWPCDRARWILLHPGARWPTKRWPVEYYQKLVHLLTSSYPDLDVAVLGTREEASLGSTITQTDPQRCLDLTGQTSLPEMIEWIRQSEILICNDTGPMHMAAALGKPVVAILGPTEARRTGPYGQIDHVIRVDLPCAPCFRSNCANPNRLQCLREISATDVFARVRRNFVETRSVAPVL
ncbi:MAG: glycosyltransferase family 9 protein, partial [Verrucomicrobia bacterium]|nr:glycosyltransferase family 9 protein [Verrucomicrobiota bacterium]